MRQLMDPRVKRAGDTAPSKTRVNALVASTGAEPVAVAKAVHYRGTALGSSDDVATTND